MSLKIMVLAASISLFQGRIYASNLRITEVMVDGTDEFIEITNVGSEAFSGKVDIVGAKTATLSLSLFIQAGESVVVGDALAYLTPTTTYISTGNGLSMIDTSSLSISLLSGLTVLNTLLITTGDIVSLNDKKTSFERLSDISMFSGTIQARSTGLIDGYIANPGFIFNSTDFPYLSVIPGTGTGSNTTTGSQQTTGDNVTTGVNLTGYLAYELLITEVYVDGKDERVEISNVGSGDFSGDIELRGVRTSSLIINSMNIPVGSSVIIADKDEGFIDASILWGSGRGLSMTDTKQLTISLLLGSILIDSFNVSEANILRFDNEKRSFEKILFGNERIVTYTTTGRVYNISGFIANPGKVFMLDTKPEELSYRALIQICPELTGSLIISEVANTNAKTAPYIEIQALQMYSGTLILTGSLLSSPLIIDISPNILYPQDYLIISSTGSGFPLHTKILTADIQWLSGGQLLLYGHSGQVLDNILVDTFENTGVYYPKRDGQECIVSTLLHHQISPGFDLSLFTYMQSLGGQAVTPATTTIVVDNTQQIIDISLRGVLAHPPQDQQEHIELRLDRGPDILSLEGYYLMIGTRKRYLHGNINKGQTTTISQNFGFPNERGECAIIYTPQGEIMDEICYSSDQATGYSRDQQKSSIDDQEIPITELIPHITIQGVVFDPPGSDVSNEVISLLNHNAMRYESEELWMKVGSRSSKTYIYDDLWGNEEKDMIGNFRFPNNIATCIILMYQLVPLDTYCYHPEQEQSSSLEKANSKGIGENLRNTKITIDSLVYNPSGKDLDNESITFLLSGTNEVDLSKFYLLIGKTKRKLQGTLNPGIPLTITKTRGFPNTKQTCVTLMQEDKPHDVYCYDPKQETQATGVMTGDEYKNHALEILDILYDPPGSDLGNESLTLHNQSDALIDLSLLHLRINERNIGLTGSLSGNEILTLTGNFRFPNKGACVSLLYQDHHFDTLCYGRDIEAKTTTGEKSSVQSGGKMPQAFIVSVLPNPIGSDTDQERVRIEIREEKIDIAALTLHVGDEKRKATREKQGSSYVAQGSFSLPNKVGCVSLVYRDFQGAKFCYINPAEGEEVYKVEGKLVTLHSDAIKALNNVTVKQDDDDCASREGLVITCKANKKPKATSSPQDSFYKAYIGELHNYLYTNRKTLYYHTDLAHYTALYRDVQSQGGTMMKKYTRSDIVSEMDKRQADNYFERVVMGLEKLAERQTTNEIKKL